MRTGDDLLFTVVTVCRNAADTIGRCVDSVVSQSDSNGNAIEDYEYLVVDGASSDKTVETVRSRASAIGDRLTVISEPDEGIYHAMNKAVAMARGRYIVFVNADDWLESGALDAVRSAIERAVEAGSNPDAVGGVLRVHELNGATRSLHPEPAQLARRYPMRMPAGHQATFVRRDFLRRVDGFDRRFRIGADYDLSLRMKVAGAKWLFIDCIVSNFTLGGASYDAVKTAREYRLVRRANGFPAVLVWTQYLRNVVSSIVAQRLARRRAA